MFVSFSRLYDANIIHLTVTVEVEVGDMRLFVVQLLLESLKVFRFAEKGSYGFEVQSSGDVRVVGCYRDCFVCTGRERQH